MIDLIQDVARCTWPYHLSRRQRRTDVMSWMPSFCSSEADCISSLSLMPHIQRFMARSLRQSRCSSGLFCPHVSLPWSIGERTQAANKDGKVHFNFTHFHFDLKSGMQGSAVDPTIPAPVPPSTAALGHILKTGSYSDIILSMFRRIRTESNYYCYLTITQTNFIMVVCSQNIKCCIKKRIRYRIPWNISFQRIIMVPA